MFAAVTTSFLVAQGCKSAESKGAPGSNDPVASDKGGPPPGPAPAGDKGGPVGPATDKNDTSFHLAIEPPPAGAPGTETVAHVVVTPGAGYHVNQDFPTKLVIQPPDGVTCAKPEQVKADAATFNDNKLQFDVKLVAAKAGTYKVGGSLKFAVCTESSCDPKKREIAFDLAAQ
jgi:hypothetical protein